MATDATRPSLLSRVRDTADQAAWSEFDSRYRDLILRYVCRQGLSAADAEDVRQLVMMRLLRVLPGFRYDAAHGRFHDYLYRVTRCSISDYRRSPKSRPAPVLDGEELRRAIESGSEPTDPTWEQEWLDHHLRVALAAVRENSDARSVAIFERLLNGASAEQAGTEFGLSAEAVHKVKQRIRDRVQARIAAQIREEDAEDG
jgi:RNA polymerase sigma factor (sigma-70 family)